MRCRHSSLIDDAERGIINSRKNGISQLWVELAENPTLQAHCPICPLFAQVNNLRFLPVILPESETSQSGVPERYRCLRQERIIEARDSAMLAT
jgi:hypothetical protein